MTTHRFFHIETAQALADRFRTSRHHGRTWNQINDRDFQRETNELRVMGQAGPQRIF